MGLKSTQIPEPLINHITQQPRTEDGYSVIYLCGCRIEPASCTEHAETWNLCHRHEATIQQAGRMLDR